MKKSLVKRIEKEETQHWDKGHNDMTEPHDMQILISLAHAMQTWAIVSALVTILTIALCDSGIRELFNGPDPCIGCLYSAYHVMQFFSIFYTYEAWLKILSKGLLELMIIIISSHNI